MWAVISEDKRRAVLTLLNGDAVTEAALAFQMLCMFGQLVPLLGDLKISLLRTGIACSFRPSFGFFGSLPVFFRSFHADALRSLRQDQRGENAQRRLSKGPQPRRDQAARS